MHRLAIALIFLINCDQVFNYGTIWAPPYADPNQAAQFIQAAPDRSTALMQVLPYRTFAQRQDINRTFPLIPGGYLPLSGNTFQDAVFALIAGPKDTLTAYLYACLNFIRPIDCGKIIIEILVVADTDRAVIIDAFNKNYGQSLQDAVNQNTQHDYKHFLTELIQRPREPDPQDLTTLNSAEIATAAQGLKAECQGWNDNRKLLDWVMMNKSKAYARQVIAQFKILNGADITQVISQYISDGNLKFGYTSLVNFINNGYNYVVTRIHDSENEIDLHATKILFITVYSETSLYELNLVFIQNYGMPIGQFLMYNNGQDPTDQLLALVSGYGIINFNGW